MKLLAGILMPQVGNFVVDVQKPFLHAFAYVGHQLGLHPGLTIQQNLSFSLLAEHKGIDDLLKSANLWRERDTAVRFLSVGQRQKVALIRIFLQKAMIWLLDEPFANLDEWSEAWLWEHLDEHLSQNGSVILTAHQRTFTREGVLLWQMS